MFIDFFGIGLLCLIKLEINKYMLCFLLFFVLLMNIYYFILVVKV